MLLDEESPTEYGFREMYPPKGKKYGPILWVPPYRCTASLWDDGVPSNIEATGPGEPVSTCPTCGWPIKDSGTCHFDHVQPG
jgi:hypothetical protein